MTFDLPLEAGDEVVAVLPHRNTFVVFTRLGGVFQIEVTDSPLEAEIRVLYR